MVCIIQYRISNLYNNYVFVISDSYVATLFISHCQTVAIENGQKGQKLSALKDLSIREESEEDGLEDESSGESDDDVNELVDFAQNNRIHGTRRKRIGVDKKTSQKNIKQRLAKLLRRFKQSEDNVSL